MTVVTDTMPAWGQHRYGEVGTVAREEAPVPAPGRGEVLLRVQATGLNNADIRVMRGERPASLPFQAVSRTRLIVNPTSARRIGLTLPPDLVAKADEVFGGR